MPTKSILQNLSFREKSAWACLLITLAIWLPFFMHGLSRSVSPPKAPIFAGPALITAIVLTIALSVAAHIAISLQSRQEPQDERDVAIASKAMRNAYVVILCSLGLLLFVPSSLWDQSRPTGLMYEALVLCFIAAEVTRFLSQTLYYRLGLTAQP